MFKEFNVKFEDVEMIGGADNILEGTEVTKVIVRGDSKMSSLDSAFKNCPQLDTIDGQIDLNEVSDIDNILENSSFVTKISLKNINNENMSVNNPFPDIEEISIGGELYIKAAIQNVIASKDWTFDNIKYVDTISKKVFEKSDEVMDKNSIIINDPLEQKATELEIIGQTYENITNGKGEINLTPYIKLQVTEDNNTFEFEEDYSFYVSNMEGQTEKPEVNHEGNCKINVSSDNGYEKIWKEL